MVHHAPSPEFDLEQLATQAERYGRETTFNESLETVRKKIDLQYGLGDRRSVHDPHEALLVFFNAWGCRLPARNLEHRAAVKDGLREWWRALASDALPAIDARLEDKDLDLAALASVFDDLSRIDVPKSRGRRTFGPVAAGKTLYVLRPAVCLPWDTKIAEALGHTRKHGADYVAYVRNAAARLKTLTRGDRGAEELRRLTTGSGETAATLVNQFYFMTFTYSARKGGSTSGG